jgi:hypothetical protein
MSQIDRSTTAALARVIAQEIVEDLETALAPLRQIASDIAG